MFATVAAFILMPQGIEDAPSSQAAIEEDADFSPERLLDDWLYEMIVKKSRSYICRTFTTGNSPQS